MTTVFVGNLNSKVTERNIEEEFHGFGIIRSIWVARNPPGFAFIDFDDSKDAQDVVRILDGINGWRVELARNARGAGGHSRGHGRSDGGSESQCYVCGEPGHVAKKCPSRGSSNLKCHLCGEPGHFARECGLPSSSGRRPSHSPRRRSPSYGRMSFSPRRQSPKGHSSSAGRRSYSRSPPPSSGSDLQCRICGKPGHSAKECRFRASYGRRRSRSRSRRPGRYRRSPSYGRMNYSIRKQSPTGRSSSARRRSDFKCYVCGEPGHVARQCRWRGCHGTRRLRSPRRYHRSPSYRRKNGSRD